MAEVSLAKWPWGDCYLTSMTSSQYWRRWWFHTVRQQAITWAQVTPLPSHMASPGYKKSHNQSYNFKNIIPTSNIVQVCGKDFCWISPMYRDNQETWRGVKPIITVPGYPGVNWRTTDVAWKQVILNITDKSVLRCYSKYIMNCNINRIGFSVSDSSLLETDFP